MSSAWWTSRAQGTTRSGAGRIRRGARLALLAYLSVPVVLTLSGRAPDDVLETVYAGLRVLVDDLTNEHVVVTRRQTEALLNLLMFLPLGLLLRLSAPRWAFSVLLVVLAACSMGIEIVQRLLLPERNPSLTDVLHNTGGAAIGLVLAADVQSLIARRARR